MEAAVGILNLTAIYSRPYIRPDGGLINGKMEFNNFINIYTEPERNFLIS
jgi:hypothetical protein